jgi:hypothetical protein
MLATNKPKRSIEKLALETELKNASKPVKETAKARKPVEINSPRPKLWLLVNSLDNSNKFIKHFYRKYASPNINKKSKENALEAFKLPLLPASP